MRLTAQGAGSTVEFESAANGVGTTFRNNVGVRLGSGSELSISVDDGDLTQFDGSVKITSRKPGSMLHTDNVAFNSQLRLQNVNR